MTDLFALVPKVQKRDPKAPKYCPYSTVIFNKALKDVEETSEKMKNSGVDGNMPDAAESTALIL